MSDVTVTFGIETSDAESAAKRFNDVMDQAGEHVGKTDGALQGLSGTLDTLKTALEAWGALEFAKWFLEASDAQGQLHDRMVALTGSGAEAESTLNAQAAAAARSRTTTETMNGMFVKSSAALTELGISTTNQIRFNETLAKLFVESGSSTEQAASAMAALNNAMTLGTISGRTFTQILNDAPALMRAIEGATGGTGTELKKMATDGEFTTQSLFASILDSSGKVDAAFSNTSANAGRSFKLLEGSIYELTGAVGQNKDISVAWAKAFDDMRALVEDPAFKEAVAGLATVFADLGAGLKATIDTFATLRTETDAWFEADAKARGATRCHWHVTKCRGRKLRWCHRHNPIRSRSCYSSRNGAIDRPNSVVLFKARCCALRATNDDCGANAFSVHPVQLIASDDNIRFGRFTSAAGEVAHSL